MSIAAPTDPHAILGVRKNASRKAIDRAYRKMAMLHHPDRNIGDDGAPARFQAIHEAYCAIIGKSTVPDNSANAAYGILSEVLVSVLSQLFEQNIDPTSRDVVALMREAVNSTVTKLRGEVRKLEKAKAGLASLRGRFGGKEGESFEGIVESHQQMIEKQIPVFAERIAGLDAAKKLLDGCTFRFDSQKVMMVNTSTATSGGFTFRFGT